MQKINGKRRQIVEILRSNRKSGSVSRTAVSKFTPKIHKYRFCACAVQMLLKIAVNATKCSTFEVQRGKSSWDRGWLKDRTERHHHDVSSSSISILLAGHNDSMPSVLTSIRLGVHRYRRWQLT